MKIHSLSLLAGLSLLCACSSQSSKNIHTYTYADLEGATKVLVTRYRRSQLTDRPQQGVAGFSFRFDHFFELPFDERVVFIMDSFASEKLGGEQDGEDADSMYYMLTCRTEKEVSLGALRPASETQAYTASIFRAIDRYSEAQIKQFCWPTGNYALFKKNLKTWKAYSGYKE